MTLARKAEETRIAAEDASAGEVRLASQAVPPEKPVSPRKLLNTAVAVDSVPPIQSNDFPFQGHPLQQPQGGLGNFSLIHPFPAQDDPDPLGGRYPNLGSR
ncbi:MAG: hypothetical protein RML46_07745 [Anaerolineae bacterium]|nr:hypothetical protein [Anaerolineae bacterium]MDW8068789.1 hypothetical protein [Anaerolineae bacterium]